MIPAVVLVLAASAPGFPPARTDPVTGMELIRLPAGEFVMGSPAGEVGREPGETPHRVRLTRAFEIGRTEVTQGQWRRVMGSNPSHFRDCGDACPVENVDWHEAREFLRRLSARTGRTYRLPTEAEWEYACRAGTATPFSTGANLTTAQANYDGRYPYAGAAPGIDRGRPTPVGAFAPNPWGLYDVHGNVWEWCEDEICPYPAGPAGAATVDPVGACGADKKVIRGGSWYFDAASARSALRYTHRPADRGFSIGLRVVCEWEPAGAAPTAR